MSETSDRARALFAAARVHGGPTAEDRDRIRAALAVRLATVAAGSGVLLTCLRNMGVSVTPGQTQLQRMRSAA